MKQEDLAFYGAFAPKLQEIHDLMLHEIQAILDSISTDSEKAPAEHLKCRIKGAESLKEKLRKNGLPQTPAAGLQHLSDVVGARVVTKKVKDYIANAKPNGYRSLHVILTMPFGVGGIETIDTEIQMRTIAMDCWASLEHQLKYKKNIRNTALIVDELKRCADEMASTDLSMQTIRDLIQRG